MARSVPAASCRRVLHCSHARRTRAARETSMLQHPSGLESPNTLAQAARSRPGCQTAPLKLARREKHCRGFARWSGGSLKTAYHRGDETVRPWSTVPRDGGVRRPASLSHTQSSRGMAMCGSALHPLRGRGDTRASRSPSQLPANLPRLADQARMVVERSIDRDGKRVRDRRRPRARTRGAHVHLRGQDWLGPAHRRGAGRGDCCRAASPGPPAHGAADLGARRTSSSTLGRSAPVETCRRAVRGCRCSRPDDVRRACARPRAGG